MRESGVWNKSYGIEKFGLTGVKSIAYNLGAAPLYEESIRRNEAVIMPGGPINAETGIHTGRSPKDKHTVRDALTESKVWWGNNNAITPRAVRNAARRFPQAHGRHGPFRPGSLWRRRSGVSREDPCDHRVCVALPFHPQSADPPGCVRSWQAS